MPAHALPHRRWVPPSRSCSRTSRRATRPCTGRDAQAIADEVAKHPLWREANETEFEHALEGVEKVIMNKLHDRSVPNQSQRVMARSARGC